MLHTDYMRLALSLAEEAGQAGDVPVGCVVVRNGAVIGRGQNRRERDKSALGHAELEAIEQATRALGDWRLDGCELYVTLEPCPMCAGAIMNARVGTLVYGAPEPQTGSCGSVLDLFAEDFPHHPAVYAGVLEDDCADVLQRFFKARR